MKLEEISKNIDKLNNKNKLDKSLDKSMKSILEVLKSDPHYYKDKEYAKKIVKSLDKIKK